MHQSILTSPIGPMFRQHKYSSTTARSLLRSFIDGSMFQDASLQTLDLSHATLVSVTFIDSDMSNADFSSIECTYCNSINVILHGAVLKNASFLNGSGCRNDRPGVCVWYFVAYASFLLLLNSPFCWLKRIQRHIL